MKQFLISLAATIYAMSIAAQVTIPFDVPMPTWEALVTPTYEKQLFKTRDLKSDILVCTEGVEWDFYDWCSQSSKPLEEGESAMVLQSGKIVALKSKGNGAMAEVEFNIWPHGIYDGFTQADGLEDVQTIPVTIKDLKEDSEVICFPDKENNLYVILPRGTEEHFGWACTFYIGRLRDGYVIFPFTCTVERNIESEHSGILNGKLGNCDISRFTLRDVEYILKHAERIEDNVFAVMYAINTDEGRMTCWFETRLVGSNSKEETPDDDNLIYTVAQQPPTYPGGEVGFQRDLAKQIRYPMIAVENNIQGTVYVRFVVEKDGTISNPEVIKKVHPNLDREALRAVGAMKKMATPAKQNGRSVRSYYNIPVTFRLQR